MPQLSRPRQEQFCQYVAEGLSAVESYMRAYACQHRKRACDGSGSLSKKAHIRKRIDELCAQKRTDVLSLRQKALNDEQLTRTWVLARLRENAQRCMQLEEVTDAKGNFMGVYAHEPNAANRALELLGKELGMFIDRTEIGRAGEFQRLSRMSPTELEAEADQIIARVHKRKQARLELVKPAEPEGGDSLKDATIVDAHGGVVKP